MLRCLVAKRETVAHLTRMGGVEILVAIMDEHVHRVEVRSATPRDVISRYLCLLSLLFKTAMHRQRHFVLRLSAYKNLTLFIVQCNATLQVFEQTLDVCARCVDVGKDDVCLRVATVVGVPFLFRGLVAHATSLSICFRVLQVR
jgi:hypothetical protein